MPGSFDLQAGLVSAITTQAIAAFAVEPSFVQRSIVGHVIGPESTVALFRREANLGEKPTNLNRRALNRRR